MLFPEKNNKILENLIFYWLPVVLWAAVIFSFSSAPTGAASEIHWQDFIVKKSAHIFVYFMLTTLTYRALRRHGIDKKRAAMISIMFAMLYGFSDEFHQSFTPGRDPRLRDVIFDTIGASLSIYTIWNLLPMMPKKLKTLVKESGLD